MTNRVEALFEPVLMRLSTSERSLSLGSKHYCQHRLLHTLALWCCWHHCDIGITGARACASKKWRLLCFDTGSAWSEVPFFSECPADLLHRQVACEVPPSCCPEPTSSLNTIHSNVEKSKAGGYGKGTVTCFYFFSNAVDFSRPRPLY